MMLLIGAVNYKSRATNLVKGNRMLGKICRISDVTNQMFKDINFN